MPALYASIIFGVFFLAILVLLHFLKPEFDPKWRMISEYEIGRYGWMMRIAFFCWMISVLTLLISIWPLLSPISGTIGRWWLGLIVIALLGAGIFKTNAITDDSPGKVNALHALGGAVVVLIFRSPPLSWPANCSKIPPGNPRKNSCFWLRF
jgi:hypothetical protein